MASSEGQIGRFLTRLLVREVVAIFTVAMVQGLLLSVLVVLVSLGVVNARTPNPRRGLKRAVLLFLSFNLAYVIALRVVYPALIQGRRL